MYDNNKPRPKNKEEKGKKRYKTYHGGMDREITISRAGAEKRAKNPNKGLTTASASHKGKDASGKYVQKGGGKEIKYVTYTPKYEKIVSPKFRDENLTKRIPEAQQRNEELEAKYGDKPMTKKAHKKQLKAKGEKFDTRDLEKQVKYTGKGFKRKRPILGF